MKVYIIDLSRTVDLPSSTNDEINTAFNTIVFPKKRNLDDLYKPKKKKRSVIRDEEFFIPYYAPDKHTEEG